MISLRRSDIHMHDTCGYYIVWVDIGGATRALRALLAAMMKKVRDHIASTHEYVGKDFATRARAMHDGEADAKPVWGETTLAEAKSLIEDGVPALPLPEPFAPPKPVDQKKLN